MCNRLNVTHNVSSIIQTKPDYLFIELENQLLFLVSHMQNWVDFNVPDNKFVSYNKFLILLL